MKAALLIAACSFVSFAAVAAESSAPRQTDAPQGAKLYGDAARGQEIVTRWCAGCHSTGPTVDERIPSFAALANNRSRSEGAIRAFLMRPHKPMPPLEISTQQIEDIVVYLRSIQPASK
jgi:mono/diheme cytochrome c family protein